MAALEGRWLEEEIHYDRTTMSTRPFDVGHLLIARQHIDPVFLDTPLATHPALDDALACTFAGKVETLNPIRSFKGRGADLFVATALGPGEAFVCASAGNFGQGMARAATRRGLPCIVFAAETANPLKVAAMRRLGADVRLAGTDFDAAKEAARAYAHDHGIRFVEDGAEPAVAEGAGTIGLELAAQLPELEVVTVPLGDGALLTGVGAAFRHAAPQVQVIGVVAEQAPALQLSLAQGRVVETERADTIADGIAARTPVPVSLEMLQGRYDAIVSVREDDILRAMRLAHETLGLVLEPAGAVGLAAILVDQRRFRGKRVATILTGSNISAELRARLLSA